MSNNFAETPRKMNENLTDVVPPIEFPCIVKGRKLVARLTHIEDHPINFVYHVNFSDGYKSSFCSLEHEIGFYDENQSEKSYAAAIRNDLKSIVGFTLDREIYCIPMDQNSTGANVWIKRDLDDPKRFSVYNKGEYIFTVAKTDKGWHAGHVHPKETLTDFTDALARDVCKYIDSHSHK
jgi:hypothetical protein